jgi:hypothetical protein
MPPPRRRSQSLAAGARRQKPKGESLCCSRLGVCKRGDVSQLREQDRTSLLLHFLEEAAIAGGLEPLEYEVHARADEEVLVRGQRVVQLCDIAVLKSLCGAVRSERCPEKRAARGKEGVTSARPRKGSRWYFRSSWGLGSSKPVSSRTGRRYNKARLREGYTSVRPIPTEERS